VAYSNDVISQGCQGRYIMQYVTSLVDVQRLVKLNSYAAQGFDPERLNVIL